jgi:serine/threonine-protein kinase
MEPTNRTPAGDQYSLGCVMYYCLTGRVPYPEGSAVEKMMAHQTKEPMDIRELAEDVPDGLVAVVRKLMAKSPEERYNGCDEVVEALEPFLGDITAIPGGVPADPAGAIRDPMAGVSRSAPGMAGLPARPAGSNYGSKMTLGSKLNLGGGGSHPGVNAPVPPSHAGTARVPAGASNPATRGLPVPKSHPGAAAPPVRTPPPAKAGPSLPSRASFSLPPMADEVDNANGNSKGPELGELAGWADDASTERKAAFGPLGLIAAAVLLMVVVYLTATLLMK